MKRRKFLQLTGIVAAGVSIPTIAYLSTGLKESTAAIIINEFYYLDLDREGVDKFVEAFLRVYPASGKFTAKVRSAKLLGMKASDARLGSTITQEYLLSTDFFRNKMDETKLVKYIGYYDPHQMPCTNPFNESFYPPK
jgi:hypothetical protein